MNKLPVVDSKSFVKFFEKRGFIKDRQSGSHIILEKDGVDLPVVIPASRKELPIEIVMHCLKAAGITRKDFIAAMQRKKKKPV